MNNSFITDVAIVSDKNKCPPGYKMVKLTVGGHDADLYEGSLAKRGERYLCFIQVPGSNTVVTELNIVKDKDTIPTGFTGVKHCKNDTSEKALRRHVFCIKTSSIQNVQTSLVDIVAVKQSKGGVVPKNCYTISNEVNGLNICYEVKPVQRQPRASYQNPMPYRPPNVQPRYPGGQAVPYPNPVQNTAPYPNPVQNTAPYPNPVQNTAPYPNPVQNTAPYPMHGATNAHHSKFPPGNNQIARQQSMNKLASAIQGIQFQVNPKFEMMWKKSNLSGKPQKTCSLNDIEKKYRYTFETEQNLLTTR